MTRHRQPKSLLKSVIIVFIAHAIFVGLMFVLFSILEQSSSDPYAPILPLIMVGLIGLMQFLYVLPLMIWFARKRQFARVKGVVLGAAVTLLLNGGCFVFFMIR